MSHPRVNTGEGFGGWGRRRGGTRLRHGCIWWSILRNHSPSCCRLFVRTACIVLCPRNNIQLQDTARHCCIFVVIQAEISKVVVVVVRHRRRAVQPVLDRAVCVWGDLPRIAVWCSFAWLICGVSGPPGRLCFTWLVLIQHGLLVARGFLDRHRGRGTRVADPEVGTRFVLELFIC